MFVSSHIKMCTSTEVKGRTVYMEYFPQNKATSVTSAKGKHKHFRQNFQVSVTHKFFKLLVSQLEPALCPQSVLCSFLRTEENIPLANRLLEVVLDILRLTPLSTNHTIFVSSTLPSKLPTSSHPKATPLVQITTHFPGSLKWTSLGSWPLGYFPPVCSSSCSQSYFSKMQNRSSHSPL